MRCSIIIYLVGKTGLLYIKTAEGQSKTRWSQQGPFPITTSCTDQVLPKYGMSSSSNLEYWNIWLQGKSTSHGQDQDYAMGGVHQMKVDLCLGSSLSTYVQINLTWNRSPLSTSSDEVWWAKSKPAVKVMWNDGIGMLAGLDSTKQQDWGQLFQSTCIGRLLKTQYMTPPV